MNISDLKGLQWARDVVDNRFKSNVWIKKSCEKYINLIENLQHEEDFKYYFDLKEANDIYNMLRFINFGSGMYMGKPFSEYLVGYQWFILENIFCWFSKTEGRNDRMIQEVVLQMGRKSSKSVLISLIEIIIMLRSPKFSHHAIAGKNKGISELIVKDMERIIKSSPSIQKYFKITKDQILCKRNESFCTPLAGNPSSLDGRLLTSFCVDETAILPNMDLISVLKLSQMSVAGSRLAFYISTCNFIEHNPFYELVDYNKKILDGTIEDDYRNFALIFELDAGDDYKDPSNWIKSSPLQATIPSGMEFLKSEFNKALEIPSKMQEFRVKILNERLAGAGLEGFVDIETLRKCKIEEDESFWYGKEVYIGLDLSQTTDLTSVCILHYSYEEDLIYCKSWGFLPTDIVSEKQAMEKVDYRRYIDKNWCITSGDLVIRYDVIEDFITDLEQRYGVRIVQIGYDRFNAISTANRLEKEGYEVTEVRQHSSTLGMSIKTLEEYILNGKFRYMENELLEIHFSNLRVAYDTNMNKYFHKKKSNGRIDCVFALITGLYLLNLEMIQNTMNEEFMIV